MFSVNIIKNTKSVWFIPSILLISLILAHVLFRNYMDSLITIFRLPDNTTIIEESTYYVLMGMGQYWLFARIIEKFSAYLGQLTIFKQYSSIGIILPFFTSVLKTITFLILFNILLQHLDIPNELSYAFGKLSSILIICAISGTLYKLISIAEELLLHHYTAELNGKIYGRKIVTQTLILKRVAYAILSIITAGSILVLFDNVRTLGASVLTTAGVVGLVLTFTAQRSLGSIFSGLEIALTQPIKMGDKIMIEKEFGTVEEINFRNVVIKLWDWRRLIVPTSYFLEQSFQNWSRVEDTNLIGTVFLYVDFTMPVSKIRDKLSSILNNTNLWDGNVNTVQVNALQENVMQLKILASAKNSSDMSDLCAFIREALITYIVSEFPNALPKERTTLQEI
ncbi:MAG: mechanosensitive ion channel [Legionella sp.]|nr:mechanosensitive ion channel [Legionella sp.]